MEIGLGVLEWTPDVFWYSTPYEFFKALKGYKRKHGIDDNSKVSKSDLVEWEKEWERKYGRTRN